MKKLKLLFCFIFLIILMFSVREISLSYSNEASLYYDGKTKSFVYFNNNTDLFDDLKDLMPGDKKIQNININLNNIGIDSNMYLKLIKNDDVLDKLIIKLYKNDKLLFDNQKNLGEYNEFSTIYNNNELKEFDLKLELEVPKELGNELQELTASFKWTFVVEDSGKYIEVPNTESDNRIYMYFITMFISLLMIILLSASVLKNKKNNS